MNKKNLPDIRKTHKNLNKINTQANIWICVLACFLSNFNPFVICAAFIGYDIFSIIFDKLYLLLLVFSINDINLLKKLEDIFVDYKYEASYAGRLFNKKYYTYAIKLISKKRNKLKELEQKQIKEKELEEKLKEEATNESRLEKTLKKQKDIFKEGTLLLKDFPYKECLVPNDIYEEILSNVDKLEKALLKNENGFVYIDTTFTLFSKEVLNLLKSFSAMEENISKENEEKLNTLLDEFNKYLIRMIEKVINQNQSNIDASYEVVIKNIKKTT